MSNQQTGWPPATPRTRRAVLSSIGVAGTVGLAGCIGDGDDDGEAEDEPLRVGVSIPESDGNTDEGEMLRDGYELAVEHLNAGDGAIADGPWDALGTGGILGRDLELVVEDTGGTESGAADSAESLLEEDIAMLTGGASREEGLALQEAANDEGRIYMGGFVPTNAVGGEACSRYGFHEQYNPQIAVESLVDTLADRLGHDATVDFTQLYPETTYGEEFSDLFRSRLDEVGTEWFGPSRHSTRTGRRSFDGPIQDILDGGPDLVVLNYYGLDGANVIRDFADLADDDVTVVVPIIGPEIAAGAGDALAGVYGTVHWLPGLPGAFSAAFEEAWDDDRSTAAPSQFAHLGYVQLCQWAAAVERAGTTDEDDVIAELEGQEYDVGTGTHLLRACDHQAMRYAPVVQGTSDAGGSPGSNYELVTSIDDGATEPPYPCNGSPAFACDID